MGNTLKKIRRLVNDLLDDHEVSDAPVPVRDIVAASGISIVNRNVEDEVSGFLMYKNKKPTIGVNKSHSPNRRRFTLAHELGHYILEHVSIEDPLRVDLISAVMMRNRLSSEGTNQEEIEANRFASELLMPKHFIDRDWDEMYELDVEEAIEEMSKKYKVSTQAMTFRLVNLKKISS